MEGAAATREAAGECELYLSSWIIFTGNGRRGKERREAVFVRFLLFSKQGVRQGGWKKNAGQKVREH